MLVSTHLLGDVERVCDRVVMVHGGHVLAQGSIAEVAGTTEPGFGIQLGDNGPEVLAALAAAGLEVRPSRGGPGGPVNSSPVSELLVQGPSDLIRDVAAQRGWPLRRMVPRAPSLEETFLRLQAAAGGSPPPGDAVRRARPRGRLGGATVSEVTAPGGTIYDRGYRHYEGPREGRGRRVRAIAVAGIRRVLGLKRNWKTKVVPWGLLVLAFGPVLAFIGVRVLFAEAADDFFTYAQYLRIVAGLLLLFAATAGPELLCPDRRQNVLALIFTRPVTRSDYLLAKLAALLAVVALIAIVPLVVLFLGNTLTADSAATYLGDHLGDLGRILVAGSVLTVFYSVVALAAASLTDRRAVATAGLLGVFLGTSALANILFFTAQFDGRRWVAFLSLSGLPGRFVDWLFGDGFDPGTLADQAGFTGPGYLVAMAVVVAVAAALLTWRVLRLRA